MTAKRKSTIEEGDIIPAFSLKDQSGKNFNAQDYRGKKLIIYFYPKDEQLK